MLAKVDGEWAPAPTRQCARLATVLAGWPGEVVDRDRIVSAIWGEDPPATAVNTLQVHVSQLRRFLGPRLVHASVGGYRLDISTTQTDVGRFNTSIERASTLRRRYSFARAGEILSDSLSLWRGVPYSDVQDPDLIARRSRLVELHEQVHEDYLECRLELARDPIALSAVIAETKEQVARQPSRERGHALLVRSLAASGRISEADFAFGAALEALDRGERQFAHPLLEAAHSGALANRASAQPRTSSSLSNLPRKHRLDEDVEPIAHAVRTAIIDDDADVVTVVTSASGAGRHHLCVAISAALSGDLVAGVIRVDGSRADQAGIDLTIRQISGDTVDGLAGIQDPGALGVIVDLDQTDKTATQVLQGWKELPGPPRLIGIASDPLGVPHEVVVDGSDVK